MLGLSPTRVARNLVVNDLFGDFLGAEVIKSGDLPNMVNRDEVGDVAQHNVTNNERSHSYPPGNHQEQQPGTNDQSKLAFVNA